MLVLIGVMALLSQNRKPLVREEISANGEMWRLEWKSQPAPVCGPADPDSFTCPCAGFAFGEAGDLDLVRSRGGQEIERLSLTPFFHGESPANGTAVIQQHQMSNDDYKREDLVRAVSRRPFAQVINLADYNHDGKATEFFLQTYTLPCGKIGGMVIGVTKNNSRLHAFETVRNPAKPLYLFRHEWEKLRTSTGSVETVSWACEDHGSVEETTHVLKATATGIEVSERTYACTQSGRGKLLKEIPQ